MDLHKIYYVKPLDKYLCKIKSMKFRCQSIFLTQNLQDLILKNFIMFENKFYIICTKFYFSLNFMLILQVKTQYKPK